MKKILLNHACAVFPKDVRKDISVLIEDGFISAIDPLGVNNAELVDLKGATLMPGMIDLHCDAIEREIEPRPNVCFPLDLACAQADKRNAISGITTVFHAIAFANHELGVRNNDFAAKIAKTVRELNAHFLVDNRLHLRYEVTDENAHAVLYRLIENGYADIISFMDHSPGRGQFKDVEKYRDYLSRSYKTDDDAFNEIMARKLASAKGAMERMTSLSEHAKQYGVFIATHDDDFPEKINTSLALGATISEFPLNSETARVAKMNKIATLFGAPNILRGKSHTGNMRALDAIKEGLADCLCADYSPAALLPSVFKLPLLADISLHEAIAMVTANPADACGLLDRGEIAVGKRADLVAVNEHGKVPHAGNGLVQRKTGFFREFRAPLTLGNKQR